MDRDILSMNIKRVLVLWYVLAGLSISIFTAFMTFYIIDVPIGMKMFSKIVMTILLTLPVIAFLSYILGSYFSKKLLSVKNRLTAIADQDFTLYDTNEHIEEIADIHKTLNSVSIQLDRSIQELKEKNSELTWMVRSFAHDFRTPMTVIVGNIEAVEDGLVTKEKLPQVLKKIKHETDYMNELLADVLSFIKSMKSVVQKERIALKKFISREIFAVAEPHTEVKFLNDTGENDMICFDKTDLKKILINLVDNSVKFTEKGSIRIYLENGSMIIQDTGPGIDTNACEKIFQPFYTVDESKNRLKSGFGLGLAIAKNLALKNGYTLRCDTGYRNGCKMILTPVEKT